MDKSYHHFRASEPHGRLILFAACFLFAFTVFVPAAETGTPSSPADPEHEVTSAAGISPPWDGPLSGPAGKEGRTIAMVCEDLRNGGILGVAQGVEEAADIMKWQVKVFDAGGTPTGRDSAVAEAQAMAPDGLILVGVDAGAIKSRLLPFAKRGVPMVGWHVGPKAGSMADNPVAVNISTSCTGCRLPEVKDVPISQCAEHMPVVTRELFERYGKSWTFAFASNDIYLLSHCPVSGYIAPVHLVTPENAGSDGGPRLQYDPDNCYREIYRRIWKR